MYPPTTLTINTASGSYAVSIPASSNFSDYLQAIYRAGGFWEPLTEPPPVSISFIPWSLITSITAS